MISDAFPSGFPSLLEFLELLSLTLHSLSEFSPGATSFGAASSLVGWSLLFLPWGPSFILLCDYHYLIGKKKLQSTRHECFYTSACLPFSLFFKPLLETGPLAFSVGLTGLAFCSVCRTRPWSRLWEGSSFWFMRTWPGMGFLWKNLVLLLSESSRRKWWISGIRRTGHLLVL